MIDNQLKPKYAYLTDEQLAEVDGRIAVAKENMVKICGVTEEGDAVSKILDLVVLLKNQVLAERKSHSSLTEAEAREIVKPYLKDVNIGRWVLNESDVITLLMHHSRPDRLGEIKSMVQNRLHIYRQLTDEPQFVDERRELEWVLSILNELESGK